MRRLWLVVPALALSSIMPSVAGGAARAGLHEACIELKQFGALWQHTFDGPTDVDRLRLALVSRDLAAAQLTAEQPGGPFAVAVQDLRHDWSGTPGGAYTGHDSAVIHSTCRSLGVAVKGI